MNLVPWHGVEDRAKLADLTASMEANGWVGAPIVVITGSQDTRALTGVHRRAAAIDADIDVPTVELDELLAETGTSFADLVDEYGDEYEAIIRLDDHLSAEVVETYGIDIH